MWLVTRYSDWIQDLAQALAHYMFYGVRKRVEAMKGMAELRAAGKGRLSLSNTGTILRESQLSSMTSNLSDSY